MSEALRATVIWQSKAMFVLMSDYQGWLGWRIAQQDTLRGIHLTTASSRRCIGYD